MPGSTPIYGLPYDSLTDPPDGADMGEDLALEIEAELARIDAAVPLAFPLASIAVVQTSVVTTASVVASKAVSWGKTLPGTVSAVAIAISDLAQHPVEMGVSSITSTGATVNAYSTVGGTIGFNVIGIGVA